jgi:hypothetical protein
MKTLFSMAALALAFTGSAGAQPALLTNGQVQVRALAGPLDRDMKAIVSATADVAWVGYDVPMVKGDRFMCDWNESMRSRPVPTSVKLEPPDVFYVLYRIEQRAVTRIRMFSEGCAIDAGGRPIIWFTGVRPRDSVALLRAYADGQDRKLVDGSIGALAMHADDSAVQATIAIARSSSSTHARGQALFWLSQRAGDQAVGAITEAIDRDPDTDVKKRAVFALSQLPKDEGVPRLIDVARSHSNPAVRKQAMFWLGQSKDPRALAFFESILLGGRK